MTMDFVFAKPADTDMSALRQGDILERSGELQEAISQAHSYYADASDYSHFLVLTQTCDLVRRGKGPPKSKYITLAAARPLHVVVDRFVRRHQFPLEGFPIPVCPQNREELAQQLLERLLHNTEDGLFFLRKSGVPRISEDLCVFLPLSIALRIGHYDACLSVKVGQLDDIFAAKVGWLAGNQYSRVATPDLEEHLPDSESYKRRFYEDVLFDNTAWISSPQYKDLKKTIGNWKRKNPGEKIDRASAEEMLRSIPDDVTFVARRAIEVLVASKILERDDELVQRAHTVLRNDLAFKRLIRSSAPSL